jgi:hypothetical protein
MISPDERKKAVEMWQSCPFVHNLTCGVDSNHDLPVPSENNEGFCIKCPICGWEQSYKNIPHIVWFNFFENGKYTKEPEIIRKAREASGKWSYVK